MRFNGANMLKVSTGAITLALTLGACQNNQHVTHINSASGKAAVADARPAAVLITQSKSALESNNSAAAISFAELAVRADAQNAEARLILAKAYLADGRFQAAADAYADLVAMNPGDQNSRFRGALAELAAGKTLAPVATLHSLSSDRDIADDVGLALALAGQAEKAVELLTDVVRNGSSTARTRQNLALAQAMAGQWAAARVTASIDLAPSEVDVRVAEWAALASNSDPAWRTARILAIEPAAHDFGRPVELAWSPAPAAGEQAVQLASAETVELPRAEPQEVAQPAPVMAPVSAPAPAPVAVEKSVPDAVIVKNPEPKLTRIAVRPPVLKPVKTRPAPVEIAKADVPAAVETALVAPRAEKPVVFDGLKNTETKTPAVTEVSAPSPVVEAKPVAAVKRVIKPLPKADGGAWVVQLGAYAQPEYLVHGWQGLLQKNKVLGDYNPLKSSIEIDGFEYYRLSIGAFSSRDDATTLCNALSAAGQACFVRAGEGAKVSAEGAQKA